MTNLTELTMSQLYALMRDSSRPRAERVRVNFEIHRRRTEAQAAAGNSLQDYLARLEQETTR